MCTNYEIKNTFIVKVLLHVLDFSDISRETTLNTSGSSSKIFHSIFITIKEITVIYTNVIKTIKQ
jgi:hypothetical protein